MCVPYAVSPGQTRTDYPIDVVKSALMADAFQRDKRKYRGALDAATKIYAEQGIKVCMHSPRGCPDARAGLLPVRIRACRLASHHACSGFIPCLARSFPANGALLVTVFGLQNAGIPFRFFHAE